MSSPRKYLTPNEVAEMLLVSPVTVRQWAQRGHLKSLMTPGGHRRFLPADVEDFARSRGATTFETGPAARPSRLLIVDDDPAFRAYATEVVRLTNPGVEVETAGDGFEAGLKTTSFRPQVVLLDLRMPRMNGLEACRAMRADPALRDMRIVAVSAFHDDDLAREVIAAGAECCLDKPIEARALLEALGLDAPGAAAAGGPPA